MQPLCIYAVVGLHENLCFGGGFVVCIAVSFGLQAACFGLQACNLGFVAFALCDCKAVVRAVEVGG